MRRAVVALLAVAIVVWLNSAQGQEPAPAAKDKADGTTETVLLDAPQEVSLSLFNGKKRSVYLIRLTPHEVSYKQNARDEDVVRYAAGDGAVLAIDTPDGDSFILSKTTGKFEVVLSPSPPPVSGSVARDKPKTESFQVSRLEQAILDLVNEERKKAGLPPLKPNEKLFVASRAHSTNMAAQNKLDHVLDDKTPNDRTRAAGYAGPASENIAWGYRDAAEVIRGWMSSPGHRANILDKRVTEAGVGYAFSPQTGHYYTMVFGARRTP